MKKILLLIPILLIGIALSQGQNLPVSFSGHVFDEVTGAGIPEHPVIAEIIGGGMVQTYEYFTNESGYYGDSVSAFSQGVIHVFTYDCNGMVHEYTENFYPGNASFIFDFVICSDSTGTGCEADFEYELIPGTTTVEFFDASTGNPDTWFWDFGDGTTSNEPLPVHTYNAYGVYLVCLFISDSTGNCQDEYCAEIEVGNIPGGCENWFTYELPGNNTFVFFGESWPTPANDWMWDFGDGATGSGQVIEHTYDPGVGEVVFVTLSTWSYDPATGDSCYATSSQEVWIGNPGGCQNWFTFYPNNGYTFTFSGEAFPDPVNEWLWEFGDGTVGYGQEITHTFNSAGIFDVCLTTMHHIPGTVDTCVAVSCQMIEVGGSAGCENFFLYESVGNLTFEFHGESIPSPASEWIWEFGDGTTGSGQVIEHTYDPGVGEVVVVTLNTISFDPATGDSCFATSSQEVWLGGQGGDCENWFEYETDDHITFVFTGESLPLPAVEWIWEFGDGATGTGQQVIHTYDPNVAQDYSVCLTTLVFDPATNDSCVAVSCEIIEVGGGPGGAELYGMVFMDGLPADLGLALLFGTETGGAVYSDATALDQGTYVFENVPEGDYYILAGLIPQSPNFLKYFPTYYEEALLWFNADVVSPGQPANPYDIHLIPTGWFAPGPGVIEGSVTGAGKDLSGITVLLMDQYENPVTFTQTDEEGYFAFEELGYATYNLRVEIAGKTSETATFTIDQDHAGGWIDFYIHENSVTLSLKEAAASGFSVGDVLPNPVFDNAMIGITTNEAMDVELILYDRTGKEVIHQTTSVTQGSGMITLDLSEAGNGFYMLSIITDDGRMATRKLMIMR